MKAAVQHDDPAARAMAARELDRRLVRLGARVAQEHLAPERALREPAGEPHRRFGVVEVRDVRQRRRLVLNRGDDPGMAVADVEHGDAGEEVQVLVAVDVPQPGAGTADELHRVTDVRGDRVVALEVLEFGEGHGVYTEPIIVP